jgi:uridine kinase
VLLDVIAERVAAAAESPIRLAGRKGRSGGTRSEAEMGPASIKEASLLLVGIGGHGAAGKTTLARTVPGAVIVSTDEFWTGAGFALDRVKTDVLDPLRQGKTASFESWNWATKTSNGTRTIAAAGVVIVEGVCALHEMLRDAYDLKVWVETPREICLTRAVERDGESEREQWINVWMPNEDAYIARDQPQQCADLVVSGLTSP